MFQSTALLGNIKVKFYDCFVSNFKVVFLKILGIVTYALLPNYGGWIASNKHENSLLVLK